MAKQRTRLPALTTLESIKEALEVRLGRRGDKRDAAVTFRDLEDSKLFTTRLRGDGVTLEPANVPDDGNSGVDLDTWVPSTPQGFLATPMFGGIFLEWDWPPQYGAVGSVELYRATENNAAKRELLTSADTLTYFDRIDSEDATEYFYWVRFRSLGDVVGPFTGPVSAVTVPDVGYMIDRLEGEINESLLAEHLRGRIDLIDAEGGLVDQVAEQGDTFARQITQVQTQVDDNYSALQQNISSRFNEATGRIESIYSLRINSNGRISGFGLADDGNESVFGVEADRFYVSGTGSNDRPFMVSGGRVYIRDAAIQDASIDSAKIRNGAITSAKIGYGAIDEAKISYAAISSAKIKNGAITNAKISGIIQSDNYSSGSRGWRIDKSGDAEFNDATFRGTVYANKIEGAINKTQAANWEGAITLPSRSSRNQRITVFNVTMPNGSSRYRPFFCFTATGSTSGSTGVDIGVSIWVDRDHKKTFNSFAMGYTGMGVTVSGSADDTYPGGSYFQFTVDMGSFEGGTVVNRVDGYFGGLA